MLKQIKVAYLLLPFFIISCSTGNNVNIKMEKSIENTSYENINSAKTDSLSAKSDKTDNKLVAQPSGNLDPGKLVSQPSENIDPGKLVSQPSDNIDPGNIVSQPAGNIDPNQLVAKPGGNIDPKKFNVSNGSVDILVNEGNYDLNVKINLLEFSIASLDDPIADSDSLDITLKLDSISQDIKIDKANFKGQSSFVLKLKGLSSSNKVGLYISTKDINGNTLLSNEIHQENISGNKFIDVKLSKANNIKPVDASVTPVEVTHTPASPAADSKVSEIKINEPPVRK